MPNKVGGRLDIKCSISSQICCFKSIYQHQNRSIAIVSESRSTLDVPVPKYPLGVKELKKIKRDERVCSGWGTNRAALNIHALVFFALLINSC